MEFEYASIAATKYAGKTLAVMALVAIAYKVTTTLRNPQSRKKLTDALGWPWRFLTRLDDDLFDLYRRDEARRLRRDGKSLPPELANLAPPSTRETNSVLLRLGASMIAVLMMVYPVAFFIGMLIPD